MSKGKTENKVQVCIDRDFSISKVDERIFGSFIEHLGRAVYEGIYQPGNKFADKNGYRKDVMKLIVRIIFPRRAGSPRDYSVKPVFLFKVGDSVVLTAAALTYEC